MFNVFQNLRKPNKTRNTSNIFSNLELNSRVSNKNYKPFRSSKMEAIFTSSIPEIPITTAQVHQNAITLVEFIKTGFGKGEFLVRCLSMNCSNSGRCKSTSKHGSLFCGIHCKAGVIASAELLSAYQLSPQLVRPFITIEKVPGGIFESKAARDAMKLKELAPKQSKKVVHNKCKKANGQVCQTPTRFIDGFCHHHRHQATTVPRAPMFTYLTQG